MTTNVLRFGQWLGVEPGRVGDRFSCGADVIVGGFSLPAAVRVVRALAKELRFDRIGWEVQVSLHFFDLIALRDEGAFENCLSHAS